MCTVLGDSMARRRSSSFQSQRPERDPFVGRHSVLRAVAPADSWLSPLFSDPSPPSLGLFEDHRFWTPEPYEVARTFKGSPARLRIGQATHPLPGRRRALLSPSVAFQRPESLPLCVRRGIRQRVLHALGVTGRRGVGRGKSRHVRAHSQVSCR